MFTTTTPLTLLQNESSNRQKNMLNTQLFQYFGLWPKNSNKTNNDAERGEHIIFKFGMLVILFCYCQTGAIQLEAKKLPKTNVAFEFDFEFVCRIP